MRHPPAWRSAGFVALVTRLYKGETLDGRAQRRAVEMGIYEAIAQVELMGGSYAGYADMMAAPAAHVALTRLVLMGKAQANNDTTKEIERANGSGGSGSSSSSGGGRTTTSRYEP